MIKERDCEGDFDTQESVLPSTSGGHGCQLAVIVDILLRSS